MANEDTPSDPQLTFVQNQVPSLHSSRYTVTTVQTVKHKDVTLERFQQSQSFLVQGPRYTLDARYVSSVFPPWQSQGDFTQTLPHIVLSEPSLPWQRTPDASDSTLAETEAPPPWLALLVFDEGDPPPDPQTVKLEELVSYAGRFFPPRTSEEGETPEDPVRVIDVPLPLFNAIAPSLKDLAWLAHVRKAEVERKVTDGDEAAPERYAVVVANRLPQSGHRATVHLVSLEGFGPYLPEEDGTANSAMPVATSSVRLVTLFTWGFTANARTQTFSGLLEALDLEPPVLQLPFKATPSGNAEADAAVRNAFGMGYTAMNHTLRDGSSTVSWYRGPLLPLGLPVYLVPPYEDSDQLSRYDPASGMFDMSYAAAWQLGRLMGLHDRGFAATLLRWKSRRIQQAVIALEQELLDEELGSLSQELAEPSGPHRLQRIAQVCKSLVGPVAALLNPTREG